MSYTKREIVKAACGEIGLSSYDFDLAADQLAESVSRLDMLMGSWNAKGIRLGYPLPASPSETDIEADSGIPDWAQEAVTLALAIRLAPSYGKAVSQDTRSSARESYNAMLARVAVPAPMQLDSTLAGAGAKTSAPFISADQDAISVGAGSTLEFN